MKSRTWLWRFLLVPLDWRAPDSEEGPPARLAIAPDLTVKVRVELDTSLLPDRALQIECVDHRIEWARVRERRQGDDDTVMIHLVPL